MAATPLRSSGLLLAALVLAAGLPGCAAVSVVTTVASAAVTVGGAAVSVAAGTVKVAGKVVEKTIDVATPSPAAPAPAK